MEIIDLAAEHRADYFACLEDRSDEIKEAGTHKETWYEKMRDKGLRVKLALDESGKVGGMIQYAPIEHSFAEGEGLHFVYCIWVHGHKQGRGNFQKKGMGKALLRAAEQDALARGAKGLAAWGISFPGFMRASWFKKQGYRPVDKTGIQVLLWKPLVEGAFPPRWIRKKKVPAPVADQVTVTGLLSGWCPAMNTVFERARRAAAECGGRVVFQAIDTSDREIFLSWGIADALFIDGKQVRTGPPPSYDKIKKKIARAAKKLG